MSTSFDPLDFLDVPSAKGGRKPSLPLDFEIVKVLGYDDVDVLEETAEGDAAPLPSIVSIRQSHHKLARCITEGHQMQQVSMLTGYAPAYISKLQNDPAFAELLAYYATQKEQMHVDVVERMRNLGVSTLDELQARLEAEPDKWTKGELMNLAKLMLVDSNVVPTKQGAAGGAPGGGLNIVVSFGDNPAKSAPPSPVIDL